MNWGRGIVIAIVLLISGFILMAYIAIRQSNEMIEDHYYDREIEYQSIIDAKENLSPYANAISIEDSIQSLWIKLPNAITTKIENGKIEFIRMDNQALDKTVAINAARTSISKSQFQKGLYRYKLSWKNDGIAYFHEEDLYIR